MMVEQTSGDRIGQYIVELELERAVRSDGRLDVLWRARHQVLPRRVAIKVSSDKRSILHEACILEELHHPGIVRVHDTGLLRDRRAWLARELVPGPTLSTVLSPGAIDRVDAISLLRDLAEILEHAHTRGVIHAGLGPDRVIMKGRTREFPLVISNWSDARAHDAGPLAYIPPRVGWQYGAPELTRGDAIDDRADIYSLGVIAYRVLTGTLPYDLAQVCDGTLQHVPTEVHCPDAPRELTRLVDQMLAFDRWDRPAASETADELAFIASAITTTKLAGRDKPTMRMRRPRWTPALEPAPRIVGTRDLLESALAEADDDMRRS